MLQNALLHPYGQTIFIATEKEVTYRNNLIGYC
jgi:hypothetical protein